MTNRTYKPGEKVNREVMQEARGRLIRILKRDVSWRELAREFHVHQHTLSNALNGKGSSSTTVLRIANGFTRLGAPVTVEQLLAPTA